MGGRRAHQKYLGDFTFPRVLRYLPLTLLISGFRVTEAAVRRRDGNEASRLAWVVLLCLASMLSITYYPDFIHIAFIAPLFFVLIAEHCDALIRGLPLRGAFARALGWAGVLGLLVFSGIRFERNLQWYRARYGLEHETYFGRVAMQAPFEVELYERLNGLLADVPARALFSYPNGASHLYLTLNAHNPTRFGFFAPGYKGPDQVEEVLATLRAKRLPFIVFSPFPMSPSDPVETFLRESYKPLGTDTIAERLILRRRDGDAPRRP